jgi:hypothetical protein
VDERIELSLENGALFAASRDDECINLYLSEVTGAADWSATMTLNLGYARKLRDWLVANVKD